jgi:uncharacterized RDD family membrane protein YckC
VNAQEPIDLNAVVTTPENIRFEYRIAGPFRRLPALIIDLIIRVVTLFVVLIAGSLLGLSLAISGGVSIMLFLIGLFALEWFYGVFFETIWNGQTPGKWLTRIRVISIDGRPINAMQAAIRNFLRLADMFPTMIMSLISMTMNKRFQRLGDLAAGTMVVVTQKAWVPPNIKFEDHRVPLLCEHIPANFRMSITLARAIALYVERRGRLPLVRKHELASYLAKPLFAKLDLQDDTSPDLLVCALYYREFIAKDLFEQSSAMDSARAHPDRLNPEPSIATVSAPAPMPQIEAPPVMSGAGAFSLSSNVEANR